MQILTDVYFYFVNLSITLTLDPAQIAESDIILKSKNGYYNVSSYKLACKVTIDEDYGIYGRWGSIRKLKVFLKLKVLLWRKAHKILPTKFNIFKRGVQTGPECSICKSDSDTE